MFFCGNMFFRLKLKYSDSQKCRYSTKNHLSKSDLCTILPQKGLAKFSPQSPTCTIQTSLHLRLQL